MKKRYYVTLTEENAEKTKDLIRFLRLRPAVFSEVLDKHLSTVILALEDCAELKKSGQAFSLSDAYKKVVSQSELPL